MFNRITPSILTDDQSDHEMLHMILEQLQLLTKTVDGILDVITSPAAQTDVGQTSTSTPEAPKRYRPQRDRSVENGNHRWSDEDLVILMRLHDRGVKNAEIAKLLGRTPRAITDQILVRKGLKKS